MWVGFAGPLCLVAPIFYCSTCPPALSPAHPSPARLALRREDIVGGATGLFRDPEAERRNGCDLITPRDAGIFFFCFVLVFFRTTSRRLIRECAREQGSGRSPPTSSSKLPPVAPEPREARNLENKMALRCLGDDEHDYKNISYILIDG